MKSLSVQMSRIILKYTYSTMIKTPIFKNIQLLKDLIQRKHQIYYRTDLNKIWYKGFQYKEKSNLKILLVNQTALFAWLNT